MTQSKKWLFKITLTSGELFWKRNNVLIFVFVLKYVIFLQSNAIFQNLVDLY
jgi:hypothetical protein